MNIFNGIGIAIEPPAEKLERLTKEAEQLSNEAKKARAEYRALDNGIKKVNELKEKRYESAEAAEEYQSAVNDLADTFPALIGGFDEAGNAILDAAAQERLLANARKESAKATYEAAIKEYDAVKEKIKAQTENAASTSVGIASMTPQEIKKELSTKEDIDIPDIDPNFINTFSKALDELTIGNIGAQQSLLNTIQITVPTINETLEDYVKRVTNSYIKYLGESYDQTSMEKFTEAQKNFGLEITEELQSVYDAYQNSLLNANLGELDQFAAAASAFNQSNKTSAEGKAYFTQMVKAYNDIYEKYESNAKEMKDNGIDVEKLDGFSTVIEEWEKVYSELSKLDEAFKANGNAVAAAYQSLKGIGHKYVEDGSALMNVVTDQIVDAVPETSTWSEFIDGVDGRQVVSNTINTASNFYNSLLERYTTDGEEKLTQVLDKMLSDSASYNANDIITYFQDYVDEIPTEFQNMIFLPIYILI